jgi:hypothetical protein
MPPALGVLLALGCLLLNGEGLGLLAQPICSFVVSLLAVAFWYLFRPRPTGVKPERSDRPGTWSWLMPAMLLLAGPAIATLFWLLEVYVIESQFYVSSYERAELLPPMLLIGLVVGTAGCVVAILRQRRN